MASMLISELIPEITLDGFDFLSDARSGSKTSLSAKKANEMLKKIDNLLCLFYAFWASTEAFTKLDINAEAVFSIALSSWLESMEAPIKIICADQGNVCFPPKTRNGFTTLDGFNLHVLIQSNDGAEKYVPVTLIQDELRKIAGTQKAH